MFAIIIGDLEQVKREYQTGSANLNGQYTADGVWQTPLETACYNDHYAVAEYLLDIGADVDGVSTEYERTPLISACYKQDEKLIALLLSRGANPNKAGKDGLPPIFVASGGHIDNPSLIYLLHTAGANVAATRTNEYGTYNATLQAAGHGRIKKLEALIALGVPFELPGQGSIVEYVVSQTEYDTAHLLVTKYGAFIPTDSMVKILFRCFDLKLCCEMLDVFPKERLDALLYMVTTNSTHCLDLTRLLVERGANPKTFVFNATVSAFLVSITRNVPNKIFDYFLSVGCRVTEEDEKAFKRNYAGLHLEHVLESAKSAGEEKDRCSRNREAYMTAGLGWLRCEAESSLALLDAFNLQEILKIHEY